MMAQIVSPAQRAGQRLMAGFDGTRLDDQLRQLIGEVRVGGLVLFSRNIETPDQLRRLCSEIQEHAGSCGQPPLLIAVDQEGGPVARLKSPFTQFAGNPAIRDVADAERFARITARELLSVGINMNLAPVLDVAPESMASIMAGRSFGGDPQRVALLGATVIDRFQTDGIMAVAKHFPGIGRTTLDSHLDLPVCRETPESLAAFDLVPFAAAFRRWVSGVMLSHIHYDRIDPQWPASLSPAIARDLLRGRMGYRGVVMTDDLDMGAIEKHFDIHTVVGQALGADIDLVVICHFGPKIETAAEAIRRCEQDRPELKRQGDAALHRILALKARYLGAA